MAGPSSLSGRRASSKRRHPLVIVLGLACAFIFWRWSSSTTNISDDASAAQLRPKPLGREPEGYSLDSTGKRAKSSSDTYARNKQLVQQQEIEVAGSARASAAQAMQGALNAANEDSKFSSDDSWKHDSHAKERLSHSAFNDQDRLPADIRLSDLEESEQEEQGPVRLCRECQCDVPGSYAASKAFSLPVLSVDELRTIITQKRNFNSPALLRYLLRTLLLQTTLDGIFLSENASSQLLANHFTCPDALISFNLEGLELDKPTSYIFTRTGAGGKLPEWKDRGRYLARQAKTINKFLDLVHYKGYADGTRADDRQLIWLVVEDDSKMEGQLELLLRESGIPFIYLAHGPTRHYGNAQMSLVLKAVQTLRDGFFGDGPVYNLDDDSRVLPELFSKIWKVQKAIVWQVGNYPCRKFDSWWEGPIFKNGKLESWQYAWLPDRVFPIDMNGFAINSSQIGPNRPIAPPLYLPFKGDGGETQFLERIYATRGEIEPLCDNTKAEKCYYTWHNSWMKPGWKDHPADA